MPSDESKIIQVFKCKDCGEEIPYIDDPVQGLFILKDEQEEKEDTVVYLECTNGHIHPYTVKGNKQ